MHCLLSIKRETVRDSKERENIRMQCLILGGAGFLGSHLANRLLREQNNIITVFDREQADFSNIKTVHNNLRMVIFVRIMILGNY